MKVLITGGCGFLGTNLANHFLEKNNQVFILDSLYRKGSDANLNWLKSLDKNHNLTFLKLDIRLFEDLESFFKKFGPFDYVCHVAGQVAMTSSIIDPRGDLMTNIIGTFNILEAIRKYSINSLLAFSSTNKVYGDLNNLIYSETNSRYEVADYPKGFDEFLKLDFSTPYGCSKGSADQYVRDWSRVYGLKTVVFRHSSIYGGRQFSTKDQGWIGWFVTKFLEQQNFYKLSTGFKPFTISGTGKQVRDVLHSDDLVNLYRLAYIHKEKVSGHVFNIGGGIENSLSIIELLEILENILDFKEVKYKNIKRRTSDQNFFVADITKAKKIINWKPYINVDNGLTQMINWVRANLNLNKN